MEFIEIHRDVRETCVLVDELSVDGLIDAGKNTFLSFADGNL